MKLTSKQKRFLILWILFNSFALFVNLADLPLVVSDYRYQPTSTLADTVSKVDTIKQKEINKQLSKRLNQIADSLDQSKRLDIKSSIGDENSKHVGDYDLPALPGSDRATIIRNPKYINENVVCLFGGTTIKNSSDFWPFTSYYNTTESGVDDVYTKTTYYGGLFNSYGFPEYTFYILFGLGIVFIPKFWFSDESDKPAN